MTNLPMSDAAMLASAINRMLRDGDYEDLEDICASFDTSADEVGRVLASGGLIYSKDLNKVR